MRALILLVYFSLLGACASSSPALEDASAASIQEAAAVDALYAGWRRAVETADIPAYVAVLHPDVRMFPPGAPVVAGSNSYAAFLQPVFAAADYRIEVAQMPRIEVLGELAIAEYEYIIHLALKNPNASVSEPGALTASRTRAYYVDVLRKRQDGTWGVWRHTWRALPE